MKNLFFAVVLLFGVVSVGEAQIADGERIVEIWTCTLNDGYSMDDIDEISDRWAALVRSNGGNRPSVVQADASGWYHAWP